MTPIPIPRFLVRALLGLGLMFAAGPQATAQQPANDFVVVVHTSNPVATVSLDALSHIFLKRQGNWEAGGAVAPVDLDTSSPLRESFDRVVHGRSSRAVAAFWQQQVFSGKDVPPPQRATDADVLAFVAANPNAIGYVSANARVPSGVKVVQVGR